MNSDINYVYIEIFRKFLAPVCPYAYFIAILSNQNKILLINKIRQTQHTKD